MEKSLTRTAGNGRVLSVACKVAVTALILLASLCLSACDSRAQDAQESLETTLSALQSQDAAVASEFLKAAWFDSQSFAVSTETFVAAYFSGFEYQIIGATLESDGTAIVEVMLTTKSMAQVLADLREASVSAAEAPTPSENADAFFMENFEAHVWDIHEISFSVQMVQNDSGDWQIADPGSFGAILLDGYDLRQIMG